MSGIVDDDPVLLYERQDQEKEQQAIGETEGPVCRVESIFIMVSVAAYQDLEIYKIDITAAYLNMPMNDNVKHK